MCGIIDWLYCVATSKVPLSHHGTKGFKVLVVGNNILSPNGDMWPVCDAKLRLGKTRLFCSIRPIM